MEGDIMRKMKDVFEGKIWKITTDRGEVKSLHIDGVEITDLEYIGYDDVCDEHHYRFTNPDGVCEGLIISLDDSGEINNYYPCDIIPDLNLDDDDDDEYDEE